MNPARRHVLRLTAAIAAGIRIEALSAQGIAPQAGVQYKVLRTAQPVSVAPAKIEVLQFFSYACPHCFALEQTLQPWMHGLASDVVFRRVPVPFLMSADTLMHSYHAFEAMGITARMDPLVFAALNAEHRRLSTPAEVAEQVGKAGGDGARFIDTFKSFGVQTAVNRSKKLCEAYEVDSTPMFAVQGRYVTSPTQATSQAQMLSIVDALVARVRAHQG